MFLRAFATLFVTFWRGRSGVGGASEGDWPLWYPTLAGQIRNTGKGAARIGHPAFPAAATNFRIFSRIEFSLRRVGSIVRFWGLIACKVGITIFVGLVVYFVWFSGGVGIWEA